jgi:fermentation-respiration switch protein FrsA (DUF1100 family)
MSVSAYKECSVIYGESLLSATAALGGPVSRHRGAARVQAAPATAIVDEYAVISIRFVTVLSQNNYTQLSACINADVEKALPEEKFKQFWPTVAANFGEFKEILETTSTVESGKRTVVVHCRFVKQDADIKLVFDNQKRIGGFWINKSLKAAYSPPGYADAEKFSEKEVRVGSGEWQLPGTLSMPKEASGVPAVVLVAGSGPNDRDETVGPNKPFKDLAWGLATRGIAVLRYEKRTRQYASKMMDVIRDLTVKDEVVDDAVSAFNLLKKSPNIDPTRIYVVGHSLGGMLIPRVGEATPEAAGFIILAGATRPLEELIVEQTDYIFGLGGGPTDDQKKQMAEIAEQVVEIKDPRLADHPKNEMILGAAPGYWLDLRSYSPTGAARRLAQRLLVIQGGRDYQVTVKDFDGWKQALAGKSNVDFMFYPDLNHLFISGRGMSTPSEYENPDHVSEQVVTLISEWINGESKVE